jgi:hypothetical protein
MTGVAWGTYNSYLDGEVDGETHWDEAQTDRRGMADQPSKHAPNHASSTREQCARCTMILH